MLRAPRLLAPYHRCIAKNQLIAGRRHYASITDLARLPKVGEELHGFKVKRCEHIPELELSALHFKHNKTGAEYLHVARDDANNVFSIGFKTNPPDATGVPHILEHVTLCGSKLYPVRDPFFKMMPRSLQNFMNAFTSSDYTMYPFATTNPQDFKNLQSVYLDATLRPLLKPSDFIQEGWRLGPENPSAPATEPSGSTDDIVFKGVVYNEMKGQMSDATYLFYIRFMEHLIPALNNSGGDPQQMTELTYSQLKQFHLEHYHPSNSRIITYGDQSVHSHLETLGQALGQFDRTLVDTDIKEPIAFSGGPKRFTVPGPVDPLTPVDAQYKTSTTWQMGNTTDVSESFAIRIATSLLLDGYGSPMYQSLIESGLGTDFTPNTGYDTSGLRGIFSIGLTGVKEENVQKIREVAGASIAETIATGLDKTKVDGLLHQLELGLKHKTATFGMDLVQRLKPGWFNGIDPFDALAWNRTVEHFKAQYAASPTYLEDLLKKYLLVDDTLTFTMIPEAAYGENLMIEEKNRLRRKISEAMEAYPSGEEALADIRKREIALQEEQEAGRDEDLECLPSLKVTDIPRQKKMPEFRDTLAMHNKAQIQWYEAPTNGLTYFRSMIPFNDSELSPELRMLVPLFTDSLLRIGTKNKSMGELEDLIKLHTGGLSFGYHVTSSPFDPSEASEGLMIASYALQNNVPKMYELLRTVLLETDLESPRSKLMVKELVSSSAASAMDAVSDRGHAYARRFAQAGLSTTAERGEMTSGITQIQFIARLAAAAENEGGLDDVMAKLKHLQSIVASKLRSDHSGLRVALTCSSDAVSSNSDALEQFLSSCTAASQPSFCSSDNPHSSSPMSFPQRALLATPFQISHIGLALPIPSYAARSSAPYAILAQVLTHKLLHPSIREQGGAYGAGASSSALSGAFGFYTYRDPNPARSVGVMADAGKWALERVAGAGIDREIDEAKMLIFQGVDAPVGVADMGMTRFLSGIEPSLEKERREWLLDVDAKGVKEAAEGLMKMLEEKEKVRWAVLGKGFVDSKCDQDGPWTKVEMGIAVDA